MSNRVSAARSFMAAHARALDRRRFELLFEGGDAEFVLGALRAYRNPDGGCGHGLEPDLRAPERFTYTTPSRSLGGSTSIA